MPRASPRPMEKRQTPAKEYGKSNPVSENSFPAPQNSAFFSRTYIFYTFVTIMSRETGSKIRMFLIKKSPWGLRGPRPRARGEAPLDNFRLSLEDTKIGRLLAQESQENPLGQARLPQGIIPRLSPDAKHPGWRLSAAGPEAQRRLDWPFSQSISGKLSFFPVALFPQEQGPGRSPPWWRFGGKASKGS